MLDPTQPVFKLKINPLRAAGCYSLHLYCKYDNPEHEWSEFPHEFTDELGSTCRKNARSLGWKLDADGTATCPKCSKRLKK